MGFNWPPEWPRENGRFKKHPAIIRWALKTDSSDPAVCWDWKASLDKDGYGKFYDGTRHVRAHAFAYFHFIGRIAEGLVFDHLCRNRKCVNPWHLEPVTSAENTSRGFSGIHERNKTTCPRGHLYDRVQYVTRKRSHGNVKQPRRRCSTCDNAVMRAWALRTKGGETAHV